MSLEAAILGLTAELKRFTDFAIKSYNADRGTPVPEPKDCPSEPSPVDPIDVPVVKAAVAKAKAAPAKAAAEVKEITVQELMKLSGEFATLHGAEGRAKLIAILKGYNAEMTSKLEKKDYPKFKAQLESLIEAKKAEQTEA